MWLKNILLYIFRRKRKLLPPPKPPEVMVENKTEENKVEHPKEEEPGFYYLSDEALPFLVGGDNKVDHPQEKSNENEDASQAAAFFSAEDTPGQEENSFDSNNE